MSKSIKKQIIEKTLTANFDLQDAFDDYGTGKISFEDFMKVIDKCGEALTMAHDAYLRDRYPAEDREADPMAYEDWREREDEMDRERMIEYAKELHER